MRFRCLLLLTGFLAAFTAGCDGTKVEPKSAATPAAPTNAPRQYHLDHAQPKLATVKLWVGPTEVQAEMCLTIQQLATGLMYRPGIKDELAMFFVFPEPQRAAFYMKNVGFDIDAAYIDAEGIIQEIVRLKQNDVTPVPSKSEAIQYVLETSPGWFERNGIKPGTMIKTSKRSLREEFGFN